MPKSLPKVEFRIDGKVIDLDSLSPIERLDMTLFYGDRFAAAAGYKRVTTREELIAKMKARGVI